MHVILCYFTQCFLIKLIFARGPVTMINVILNTIIYDLLLKRHKYPSQLYASSIKPNYY